VSISIPNSYVNPHVRTLGISKLRAMNASQLREIDKTLVIQENDQPLAVLVRYEEYIAMQKQLLALFETRAVLSDNAAVEGIRSGRAEARSGNTRTLSDVRENIKKKNKEMA